MNPLNRVSQRLTSIGARPCPIHVVIVRPRCEPDILATDGVKQRGHGQPAEVEFYPSGPHFVTIDGPFRLEIINVYVRRKGKMGSPSTKLVVIIIIPTFKEGAFITLALIPPGT
jgi:hypothetical protein